MSNSTTIIIILAIFLPFLALAFIVSAKKRKEMIEKGEILERRSRFEEMAEIFTLKYVDGETVRNAIRKFDAGRICFTMQCDTKRQVYLFASSNSSHWTAQMRMTEQEGGLMSYRFEFTHLHQHNGSYDGEVYMNMLLTAIEKMFLSLDPDAKIQTARVSFKTKRTLW